MPRRKTPDADEFTNAVYFLFLDRELVYVGRSRDPETRIASHRRNGRPFDDYVITPCREDQWPWLEGAIIAALAPHQNRMGKPMHEPVVPAPRPNAPSPVIYQYPAYTPDPNEVRSAQKWEGEMASFALGRPFKEALAAGEIPFMWNNPKFAGKGGRRLLKRSDVMAWAHAKQKERMA